MKTCDTTSPCLTRNGKVGGPTAPPAKRQKTSSSSSSSAVAPVFSSTRCDNLVPVEVWKEHICQKYLNPTELSILRRCHTFFEKYWQNVMAQKVMRVQVQVPGYPVPRADGLACTNNPRTSSTTPAGVEYLYSQYTLDGMSSLRVGHSISQKKKKRRNINFYLLLVWVVVPYTKLPVACLYCGQTTCIVKPTYSFAGSTLKWPPFFHSDRLKNSQARRQQEPCTPTLCCRHNTTLVAFPGAQYHLINADVVPGPFLFFGGI